MFKESCFTVMIFTFAVDPAFDEELWRLRQEVNHLKETLAMERAYIQTMPQLSATAGTQVQFDGTTGTPNVSQKLVLYVVCTYPLFQDFLFQMCLKV